MEDFSDDDLDLDSLGDDPESHKRQKRLERNRFLAKKCRQRKKLYLQALEDKVKMLQLEIDDLQKQEQTSHMHDVEKRKQMTRAFQNLLTNQATDNDINMLMANFGQNFADNCKARLNDVNYHFNELRQLLVPLPRDKLILWGLSQSEEFQVENSPAVSTGIWRMLCQEIEFTPEQQDSILAQKDLIASKHRALIEDIKRIEKLRNIMTDRLKSTGHIVRHLHDILTPRQAAKFLLWIEQQQACMQVVDTVWLSTQQNEMARHPTSIENIPVD